ncbi:hypothetical protein SAMN03159496_03926 [Rhizobium sp. NFR07]|uniref:hypothetical protein n=1 Tax=Rhizobium sp. NFR07 TaxID=1566262 RepID=UPI0008F3D641|nr:hypothetical protein [Rhizobium sp. NFR07]SFB45996.1 hypothetical protein SAMN03159496_03926 [Rhizobium sp. NFR07]
METGWSVTELWLAVVLSGAYHGINPAMGWPLAVSAGLMERRPRALALAMWQLAIGHTLAILLALLPFAILLALVTWLQVVRVSASLLVIGFGIYLLVNRRHPRVLARIRPTQLGLWSFVVATAHGAGLMLVPLFLGLCRADESDRAAQSLMAGDVGTGLLVSAVHTLSMIAAGGGFAWVVYRYVGLKAIAGSWFNLDRVWAASLVAVGSLSLIFALESGGM